tara:strand:+ start:82 stop:594 length:513 start_codon:yes stop_codon:yes gene_type:complete
MNLKIIDNFLPEELHKKIKNFLYGPDCPWFYREIDVAGGTKNKNGFYSFCYYNAKKPDHPAYYDHIEPIWELMNLGGNFKIGITQVRANLTFRDIDTNESGFHTDKDKGTSSILILASCNAKTVFVKDAEELKVDSVDNRLVTFDSNIMHKVIYQTDVWRRVVININYFC